MSKKKKLVPKLRFPEFTNEGEWIEKELGAILQSITNGLSNEQTNDRNGYKVTRIETISNKAIDLKRVGYIVTDQDISEHKLKIGDILLSNINSLSHIGKAVLIDRDYDLYHGMNLLRLVVDKSNNASFVSYQIDSNRIKKSIELRANRAINQASINQTELKKTIFFIPPNKIEQQKIASCLSSLDKVIAEHKQKLELLKEHKKGLMQNLFPQEGEKVPKYRFSKYRKDKEWELKIVSEIAQVSAGGTPESTNPEYWGGDIPWMNSGELNNKRIYSVSNFITSKGYDQSSTKLIPSNCVLIGLAGQGKTRGTAAINYIELCTNQSIGAIHPNEKVFFSEFLYQVIDSMYEKLRLLSAGDGGRGGLNLQILKSIKLLLPSIEEQKEIAYCLSAIDGLITVQTEKIEQLKLHKKGMMQGLFPKMND